MRKGVLLIGAMVATMLTASACGNKNTTETTAAVGTTTAMETTMEESITEEPTVTAGEMESERAEDLMSEQIKSFAEEIQAAVAAQDIDWLASLSSYPMYVNLEEGESSEIENVDDFMAIGGDKPFAERLMTQIADTKPEELEVFGVSVIMGEDVSITFNNVNGEPKIAGTSL